MEVSWFVGLAPARRQIETAGKRPLGLLDACIAIIPKAEGDSTPLGQRLLCVSGPLFVWPTFRIAGILIRFQCR